MCECAWACSSCRKPKANWRTLLCAWLGSLLSPTVTPCFKGSIHGGLMLLANCVIIQAVMEIMATKGNKCFVREQRQGDVFIRMSLAVYSALSQGLPVPARCFAEQMPSVSCKSFVSDGRERRINIFGCSYTSNRESLPDPSHCTKITTANLKIVFLSRRDAVSHLRLRTYRACSRGVSNWVRGREILNRYYTLAVRTAMGKTLHFCTDHPVSGCS